MSQAGEKQKIVAEAPWGSEEITLQRDSLGRVSTKLAVEQTSVRMGLMDGEYRAKAVDPAVAKKKETTFQYVGETDRVAKLVEREKTGENVSSTRTAEFTYNDEGKLSKKFVTWVAFNGNEMATYSEEARKWENGRPTEIYIQSNSGGERTRKITRTRTYDADGRVLTETDLEDLGGGRNQAESYAMEYDDAGRLSKVITDFRGNKGESRYEYHDLPDGTQIKTRRNFSRLENADKLLDAGGERLTIQNGKIVAYESWLVDEQDVKKRTWKESV